MSAQDIAIARQNLAMSMASIDPLRAEQMTLAVEDLIRAYLVNHAQFTGHNSPIVTTRLSDSSTEAKP